MTSTLTLDPVPADFPHHAVSSEAWRKEDLLCLFSRAEHLTTLSRARLAAVAPYAQVGLLFYQNSTRTRISFEAAAGLLGGRYVGFADSATTRAGDFFQESLEDTVRVIGSYADLLVLRHVDDDAAQRASLLSPVPVINAGTGESDHPTQGMLDTWMMHRQLGDLTGARIGLVGDPGCRALRAILTTVCKFGPSEVVFLTPPDAPLSESQQKQLAEIGVRHSSVETSTDLLRRVDVVSMIPFELPDFHVATAETSQNGPLAGRFQITRSLLEKHGPEVTVLHTGPRGEELTTDVDTLPNVHYFEGVRLGMYLRAALMTSLWEAAGVDLSRSAAEAIGSGAARP